MLLVLSITFYFHFNIWVCMCSTGLFQYRRLKGYISIGHVIIIIKSEVTIFPIVIIFSVGVCLRCLLHHILSLIAYTFRENRVFVFIIIVQFMMRANSWIRFGLQIVFVCRFLHYTISLSLCKLIWRHWTYKMLVRYILSCMCVRLSIFSRLSIIQYVGCCVFSLPVTFVMIGRIDLYILCLILSSSNRRYEPTI